MLKRHSVQVLLVTLVLLLGIELTGLNCLGEWQAISTVSAVKTLDRAHTPDGGITEDGCPCHFVFESGAFPTPDIIVPLAENVRVSATFYVPTFVVILFHPPLSI